jgi:hypothetical protein
MISETDAMTMSPQPAQFASTGKQPDTTTATDQLCAAIEREALRRIAEKAPDTRLSYTAKELDDFITACGTRPPAAVVDYTERATGLLRELGLIVDQHAGPYPDDLRLVVAALSAVASERDRQSDDADHYADMFHKAEETIAEHQADRAKTEAAFSAALDRREAVIRDVKAERDAALAKLARLREPDVRGAVTTKLSERLGISYAAWAADAAINALDAKLGEAK